MEIQNLKRAIMQGVRLLFKPTLWMLFFIMSSCNSSSKKYEVKKFPSILNSNHAVLVINVRDSIGKEFIVSAVKVNKTEVYESDSLGNIIFTLEGGTYTFTGLRLHYSPVESEEINIASGDSVVIDFFLESDRTPLYN